MVNYGVEYRDPNPLTGADVLHIKQMIQNDKFEEAANYVADFVKHKMIGASVRASLALWVEVIGGTANGLKVIATAAEKLAKDNDKRLDAGIGALTKDSEVVIARGDFPVLDKRLTHMEETMATQADLQFTTTRATLRRLGQKYRQQGVIASNAQGFAALNDKIAVQYFQNYSPLDTNIGTLVKFDVATGEEIISNEVQGYHGNAMTYNQDDGMLYLAAANGKGSGTILQISPDDLEVKKSIDLTSTMKVEQAHSIGYDNIDKIYVVADNKTLDFYDSDWKLSYTLSWSDIIGFEPHWMQGVQCNGDTLYWIGGRKSQIWSFKIDKDDKSLKFKTIYTFDDFQENLYPTGEIEGLGFNNQTGKIYVCSHISVANFGGLTEYFETGMDFKSVELSSTVVTHQTTNAKQIDLYAGGATSYNPDGTQQNPFASLLEATTCMRSPYVPFPYLKLNADFPDETLVFASVHDAMFSPLGHQIKAAVIVNSSNLYLTELQTTGWSHWNTNALYVYNSIVRINNFRALNLENELKVKDSIYIERSTMFGNFNNNNNNIAIYNSELTVPSVVAQIVKENRMSRLHGKHLMGVGRIQSVSNVSDLSISDFLYYDQMNVQITAQINDKAVVFNLSSEIGSSTVDLVGFAQKAGVMYLCSFHYVKDNADNTTIDFYQFPSMNKVSPSGYAIDATVSDR